MNFALDGLPSDLGAHLRRETISAVIKRPTAPFRSLLIGDVSYYPSEYIFGVAQGVTLLGGWHSTVDIRCDIGTIVKRVREIRPTVAWGHMILWSSNGPRHTENLLQLCEDMRRTYGTKVVIHDGDARKETRYPHDVSHAVDLALCNHTCDRSAWNVKVARWPYFCFVQRELAPPHPDFVCDLAFAGRQGGGLYQARTELLIGLKKRMGDRFQVFPNERVPHTLFRTPEMCASATAVLGHGRPEESAPGWCDVRTFLIPGAGGVLIHDDAHEFLEPNVHFIPCRYMDGDSIVAGVEYAKEHGERIRREAFRYVQAHHSSVVRVRQALDALGMEA